MLKNSLFSPLYLAPFFCFSLFFFFSFQRCTPLFLFCFLFPTLLFCSSSLFLFFLCVALYFSAQNTSFSAQTFFSPKTLFSAQNVFASAQNFFSIQPKTFFYFLFFYFFSSATLLFFFFSALFFSGSALSFFLFQCLFFSSLFLVSHAAVLLQPSFPILFVYCPLFFRPKYFCLPRCYFSQPTPLGILS